MIEITNLSKGFGQVKALDSMNCTIPDGCIFGMVGANGAGKSTLLRLISGIYLPDEGSVKINGEEVYDNPKAKESIVFSSDLMRLVSNGASLKRMAQFYASVYKKFSFEKFEHLASIFNLKPSLKVRAMSKGMTKQSQTILSLACNTDIMLFDETFDGLDPIARNVAKKLLYREVCDNGTTIIVTSHSLRELEDTCDQLAMVYKGKIVLQSDVSDLKTKLFKVQLAFEAEHTREEFAEKGLEVLSFTKSGRVVTMILKGERDEAEAKLNAMNPLMLEVLPLSLEEVFTYEMNIMGYKFDEID
ncbi:MAG: ABC transporter ATP-binding protein [Clostridia bacterium]|nr:ABC transporter ATP-binding protein [Clostridia bacterium]